MVWLIEKISLFFNGNAAKISLFHVQIAILRLYFAEYLFCDKSKFCIETSINYFSENNFRNFRAELQLTRHLQII
jgi:hypothetical protein